MSLSSFWLNTGAGVNISEDGGETAWHDDAWEGQLQIGKLLLTAGAEVNVPGESETKRHCVGLLHKDMSRSSYNAGG